MVFYALSAIICFFVQNSGNTNLPQYYDSFGDTLSYENPQSNYWTLKATYTGSNDYLEEIIYLYKYTGTVPPPEWLND